MPSRLSFRHDYDPFAEVRCLFQQWYILITNPWILLKRFIKRVKHFSGGSAFVKNVTFRVQSPPYDKILIDFLRCRKRLHVSDLLKAKDKSNIIFFLGVVCFYQLCHVSDPDGSVWKSNDWCLENSAASTRFGPPQSQITQNGTTNLTKVQKSNFQVVLWPLQLGRQ